MMRRKSEPQRGRGIRGSTVAHANLNAEIFDTMERMRTVWRMLFRKFPEAHIDALIFDTAGDCDITMRGCRVVEHADAKYQRSIEAGTAESCARPYLTCYMQLI